MSLLLFPALFLLATAEPQTTTTTEPAPQPAVSEPAPEAKPEKPKMICRNERVTGSRVEKQRVCRPAGGTHNDLDAATQRNLGVGSSGPDFAPSIGGREGL
jgi:hypothetical protein